MQKDVLGNFKLYYEDLENGPHKQYKIADHKWADYLESKVKLLWAESQQLYWRLYSAYIYRSQTRSSSRD